MTNQQRIDNLSVPQGRIDVVLDTDTFNEVDDQFAIAYMLRSDEKLDVKAIYAAPFLNQKVSSPAEGMEKSYEEIKKILKLAKADVPVFKGSTTYLPDEKTPVISDVAKDLAERANNYTPEKPLYVVSIGAITNIASAILLNPKVAENTVVVWLGGHALHYHNTLEFNMMQDIAAARVVIKSGVPFVQLPCWGVVSSFTLSEPEIHAWLSGKNELTDYLTGIALAEMAKIENTIVRSRVIWDVTAVAWLLNDGNRFMLSRVIKAPLPTYDNLYQDDPDGYDMRYVYFIDRDCLLNDLIRKLSK